MWALLSQGGNCKVEPHKLRKLKAKLANTALPCKYCRDHQEIPVYRRVRRRKNVEIKVMSVPRVWFADEYSETKKANVRCKERGEKVHDFYEEEKDELISNEDLAVDNGTLSTYLSDLLCCDCYITLAMSRCSVVQRNNTCTQTRSKRNEKMTQATNVEDKSTSRRVSSNYFNSPLFDFLNDHSDQPPKQQCSCFRSSPQLHYK